VVALLACPSAWAGADPAEWRPAEAAKYLDQRVQTWFAYAPANRGEGATKTTCVSCHTMLPFALARPVLRQRTGGGMPTEAEKKLLAQTRKRVENWKDLDSASYALLYSFDDQKKKESWGTEAVVNAVLLAIDDRYEGRSAPSDVTRQAFANLWKTQIQDGDHKGVWDWLDFGYEPWEAKGSRYFGAALAALAVGTAPGYYPAGVNPDTEAQIKLLRGYLKDRLPAQNLYNRAFALWASTALDGILSPSGQKEIIGQLWDKQQADGGWSLSALGPFTRRDGTAQETTSDGYATGLVVHVLLTAGVPKDDARLAKGLGWLKSNQAATGEWRGVSVNKNRDPATHVGKFMSDAGTAYAVLALSH
jgi:squalene-hopene/tetraprenyl-beta-curcumene cyclase